VVEYWSVGALARWSTGVLGSIADRLVVFTLAHEHSSARLAYGSMEFGRSNPWSEGV
jgi:isoprenylcysteine carboxyl methyltransferase (ICMT) family protein YpbQ